jgi:DNA-binding LacI/PurR family transcriptional regulator
VDSIAQQVVELLSSRLEGSYAGPPRRVTVRGELIVRQSTAAPKGE